MVARLDRRDPGSDLAHDPRALMAENGRELALGIEAQKAYRRRCGKPRRHDLDQHLARFRAIEVHSLYGQGRLGLPGDSRTSFHGDDSISEMLAILNSASAVAGNNKVKH